MDMTASRFREHLPVLLAAVGLAISSARLGWCRAEPTEICIASQGKPAMPIVVSKDASDRTQEAARSLAGYLWRITGADFDVTVGDGRSGLAVGTASDFSRLPYASRWTSGDPTRREDYVIRTHAKGIHVVGATELAVQHAVWDLLYRIGYRQFFPGETWEVIPSIRDLSVAVDAEEYPCFYARRIWYGYGPWDYAVGPYKDWCAKNRATSGIVLRTGHAYDGIIRRNRKIFDAHPEYLGLVDGERKSTKICIANPAVRELVIDDTLARFAKEPNADSTSVDPSDGLGWCECSECAMLGSISDRALTLANQVAAVVNERFPGRYVGMYAYSAHSPPPSVRVHPQVVISVATAFIRGGYSVDDLVAGWQRQGATLGIREYFSVNTWDRDLPGKSRGSNIGYVKTTTPHFHDLGARFFSSESSDNWGPNGLGYYLAARILWDVREAEDVDALVADFLDRAFGPAREPMAEFYRLIDGANRPLLSDDLIGRMYRLLAEARGRTDDARISRRIDDLVLYARYVELWSKYANATGAERQAAFEMLVRYAYRMRRTMMIHAKAIYRDVVARDKAVDIPPDATWSVPENRNPWKSSEPFSRSELDRIVTEGIASNETIAFESLEFSDHLIPASKLDLPDVPIGSMGLYLRGERRYYTWIDEPNREIHMLVKGGLIYRDRGDVRIAIQPASETESPSEWDVEVPADQEEHDVALRAEQTALHCIWISDGNAGTRIAWPDSGPMTVRSSPNAPAKFHGRWSLYFYVPKGTKIVGGYSSGAGTLCNGSGEKVFIFEKKPGYFSVPVGRGEDGRLWKFDRCLGQRLLMTVPPYLARSADELLLPKEIVERGMSLNP